MSQFRIEASCERASCDSKTRYPPHCGCTLCSCLWTQQTEWQTGGAQMKSSPHMEQIWLHSMTSHTFLIQGSHSPLSDYWYIDFLCADSLNFFAQATWCYSQIICLGLQCNLKDLNIALQNEYLEKQLSSKERELEMYKTEFHSKCKYGLLYKFLLIPVTSSSNLLFWSFWKLSYCNKVDYFSLTVSSCVWTHSGRTFQSKKRSGGCTERCSSPYED